MHNLAPSPSTAAQAGRHDIALPAVDDHSENVWRRPSKKVRSWLVFVLAILQACWCGQFSEAPAHRNSYGTDVTASHGFVPSEPDHVEGGYGTTAAGLTPGQKVGNSTLSALMPMPSSIVQNDRGG